MCCETWHSADCKIIQTERLLYCRMHFTVPHHIFSTPNRNIQSSLRNFAIPVARQQNFMHNFFLFLCLFAPLPRERIRVILWVLRYWLSHYGLCTQCTTPRPFVRGGGGGGGGHVFKYQLAFKWARGFSKFILHNLLNIYEAWGSQSLTRLQPCVCCLFFLECAGLVQPEFGADRKTWD